MVKGLGDISFCVYAQAVLAITPCVMTRAVLAIPEMECKRVLVCMDRLIKTNRGVTTRLRQKFFEKYFVNSKVFCLFTLYNYFGVERKERTPLEN